MGEGTCMIGQNYHLHISTIYRLRVLYVYCFIILIVIFAFLISF